MIDFLNLVQNCISLCILIRVLSEPQQLTYTLKTSHNPHVVVVVLKLILKQQQRAGYGKWLVS